MADKTASMSRIGRRYSHFHQFSTELVINGWRSPGALMDCDISTSRERRGLAAAFTLCALASVTLLANHPSGSAGGLAALLKEEATHRVIDGVVHGGFVVTLNALII